MQRQRPDSICRRVGERVLLVAVELQLPPFKLLEHDSAYTRAEEQNVRIITLHAHQKGQCAESNANA